jgi:hypothetical protein
MTRAFSDLDRQPRTGSTLRVLLDLAGSATPQLNQGGRVPRFRVSVQFRRRALSGVRHSAVADGGGGRDGVIFSQRDRQCTAAGAHETRLGREARAPILCYLNGKFEP